MAINVSGVVSEVLTVLSAVGAVGFAALMVHSAWKSVLWVRSVVGGVPSSVNVSSAQSLVDALYDSVDRSIAQSDALTKLEKVIETNQQLEKNEGWAASAGAHDLKRYSALMGRGMSADKARQAVDMRNQAVKKS